MDESLKQRLVGAAVLVVLAVIFVPMVLDGPDQPPATAPTTVAMAPAGASAFRYDLNAPLPAAAATTAASAAPPSAPSAGMASTTAAPMKPAATAVTKAKAVAPIASAPKPESVKPAASTSKPATAPAAAAGWAAQVGSFSKQATADGVAADLKTKGFKAFVMPHQDGKQTLYRVRVGPVATREAADALAKKITAKTGQAARPVPHP